MVVTWNTRCTYLMNMYTPVGSIALDMPFHDAIMLYFCLAVSGSLGSGGPGLGGSSSTSLCLPPRSSPDVAELASLPRSQPIHAQQQPSPGRLLSRGREPPKSTATATFLLLTPLAPAPVPPQPPSQLSALLLQLLFHYPHTDITRTSTVCTTVIGVIGALPGLYARTRGHPVVVFRTLFHVDDRL